jgi:uncharacterized protein with ParB-like and HNH nuclease domain
MAKLRYKSKLPFEGEAAEVEIKSQSIPYDYDTKEYPIEVLLQKLKLRPNGQRGSLYVPEYQRDFVWKEVEQSRFIESILLGVPIQPVFVAVDPDTGDLEIIDGSQRIRTIEAFVSNKLTLQSLDKLDILNGFRFTDLTPSRQTKFFIIDLRFHVITDKADAAVRADIFNRINTHGKILTRSEIRKGAFAGPFYDFILSCIKHPLFEALCPVKEKSRGEAEELVLRFFAYSDTYLTFKHDVFIFLDRYLKKQNEADIDFDEYTKRYVDMLTFVSRNFPFGFRKKANDSVTPRVRFEAISVGVYLALAEEPNFQVSNVDWLKSLEFKNQTTSDASNNNGRLRGRVEFVRDCLLGHIDATQLTYGAS